MHDLQKGSISWLLFIHQSQYDYENIFSRLKFWFYLKKEKENLYFILVDIWFSQCTFFEYTTPNLEDYCKYYKEHIRGVLNSRICDYQWNGNTLYL